MVARLIAVLVMVSACGLSTPRKAEDAYSRLKDFLVEARGEDGAETAKVVVVLSESGCMSCNRQYAKWMEDHMQDSHYYFVIEAIGTYVDISAFGEPSPQFYMDKNSRFTGLGLLQGSGAIFMGQDRIDTIVALNAKDLDAQIAFIDEHGSWRSDTLGAGGNAHLR